MPPNDPWRVAQRGVITAVLAGTPLVFLRTANDAFGVPKVVFALAGIGLALALGVGQAVATGGLPVRRAGLWWALGAFALALAVATWTAPDLWLATAGTYGRWTGAMPYVAYALFAFVVTSAFDPPDLVPLLHVLVGVAAVAGLYAIVQWFDPDLTLRTGYGRAAVSTLGNPNFAAAYLAISLALIAWVVAVHPHPVGRAAGLGAAVLAGGGIAATGTLQGPLAAAIGLAVFGAGWLALRPERQRRTGFVVAGVVAAATLVAVPALGLLPRLASSGHIASRSFYWEAAARMFADHPVLGVGMDHYAAFYRAYKPAAAARRIGTVSTADAAHNVPLGMFASGGVLLGLAYLAVVVGTALLLVRAWRASSDRRYKLVVAAVAGAWAAYQAQSLVSIDAAPLAVMHWGLVGITVVLARPEAGRRSLPWRRPERTRSTLGNRLGAVVSFALVAPLLVLLSVPLRADTAAAWAQIPAGEPLEEAERATSLVPWESRYWFIRGSALVEAERYDDALDAFERGAAHHPRDIENVVSAARTATRLSQDERALRWYERAWELAPNDRRFRAEAIEAGLVDGPLPEDDRRPGPRRSDG